MRNLFVLFLFAFTLTATVYAQEYEPNWGEVIEINTNNCGRISGSPTWSPDGTMLAFSTSRNGIWTVDVDGGSPTLVYNSGYGEIHEWPCFTPDEAEVTLSVLYSEMNTSGPEGSLSKIVSADVATGESREITTGRFPSWSPSGRYLCHTKRYYPGEQDGDELIVYDTVTETETTLATTTSSNAFYSPTFFPDESEIIYSHSFEGAMKLYRIPVTGGEPEEIVVKDTDGNQYICGFPQVHPDGIHMVGGGRIPKSNLRLLWVNINTGTCTPLTPEEEDYSAQYPALSPDGMRVSFKFRDPSMESSDPSEYHILELDESLFDDGGLGTAVEEVTPATFPTLASYPNPFNPTTNISFTVPGAGFTELAVYNMAGQRIRTLVAGELSPGVHNVVWDGRNDSGNPVSSGIFVSRLVTGDNVVTNRMTIVK